MRIAKRLVILFLILCLCAAPTLAAALPTGSITVNLHDGGMPIVGMELTLHLAGQAQSGPGGLRYVPAGGFSGWTADFSDISDPDLAQALANYAAVQQLSGVTAVTDVSGSVTFSPLATGLYLIVPKNIPGGPAADPFLVSIPQTDGNFNVNASPKVSVIPPDDTPETDPDPAPDPDPERDPDPAKDPLPDTGLLQWPVPTLAVFGLLLVLCGAVLRRRSRGSEGDGQ